MRIDWHPEQITEEIENMAIARIELAAAIIRDKAKENLSRLVTGMTKQTGKNSTKYFPWKEHGPYKRHRAVTRLRDKRGRFIGAERGGLVNYEGASGSSWTARYHDFMVKTIRLSPHDVNIGTRSVRIIAGNYNTWWAKQLEFGKGEWRGGAKPFLRPAMAGAKSFIQGVLEGGASGHEVL